MKIDGNNPLLNPMLYAKTDDVSSEKIAEDIISSASSATESPLADSLLQITEKLKFLNNISNELSKQSPVDAGRVEEVKLKLQNFELSIQQPGEAGEKAAEKIAKKMMEMEKFLSK
ncbi:hypothetical protein CC99x_006875 [Candidatus Berkiella cookevillensis]|uniref:Uncharacterized protein n=1 Tax=Candidatus Berkiella cookevillensis TaxID=437022 RepID=A0A0Q9YJA9_9GAMM|nr:flagellar biosynthesis anti-sigma factor FlgM [Candidatus Berkiella cookevillensis]MCS5708632.1 hypothetical protein [Candidatus Berkiella cookevillensis]